MIKITALSISASLLCLAVLCLTLSGCGGGAGTSARTVAAKQGALEIKIQWPRAQSGRLIPSAAQSIKLETKIGGEQALLQMVARQAGVDTQTVNIGLPAAAGTLIATAYPQTDGSGVAQAVGVAPFAVQVGQTTTVALSLASTIQSVQITPNGADLGTGQSASLTATAYDAGNQVVLTSPSKWTWSLAAGSDSVLSLAPNGNQCVVTAAANGTGTVQATETETHISGSTAVNVSAFNQNGGSIHGAVTNVSGKPLAGIHVVTSYGFRSVSTLTNSSGQYSLTNVPAGDRVVSFYGQGSTTNNQVTLAAGGSVELNVQITPFAGQITSAPVVSLNSPVTDDANAMATISGTITQLDSSQGVVIINGAEFLFDVGSDGHFSVPINLSHGANAVYVRAANALGVTISPVISIPISGVNSIVGSWSWTLQAAGSTGFETGTSGFDNLNADGTYNDNNERQGTYTYSNNLLKYVTGSSQSYYIKWISANEALWTNTNSSDGRVYTFTRNTSTRSASQGIQTPRRRGYTRQGQSPASPRRR